MRRFVILLAAVALIPGCELIFGPLEGWRGRGDATGSPQLKAFESEEELNQYLADQIRSRNDRFASPGGMGFRDEEISVDSADNDAAAGGEGGSGDFGAAPPAVEPTDSGATGGGDAESQDASFSETTIQEEGVDEADVVKTDGTYLYIISGERLRIVRASPPERLALAGEVSLEGYGREIYLHEGKIVAITETYGGPVFVGAGTVVGDSASQDATITVADIDVEYRYERPKTIVTVIDASTASSPRIISATRFDGSGASSRMIGGVLHLVLANYQDYYYDVLPMLGRAELNLETVDVKALLPGVERASGDGTVSSEELITWRELYRPTDPDGFGVVTVVSMDVNNSTEFKAVGVVAEPGLIYSSINALYLTDTNYDSFGDTRETTDIYKFAYRDGATTPVAAGTVPGRVLNQYSMGEYDGYLRVATTVGPTFGVLGQRTESKNNVYVLGQVDNELKVVGSVESIAAGEEIRSARFAGPRGYVVTFEQIDPLFTLDLSDPTAPRIVGELKVPGFSTFVVPMDSNHLLTVGQYVPPEGFFFNWGVQLSIFDISDFGNPVLEHLEVIGETEGSSSEALYDPKAFTYFAEAGMVALPVSIHDDRFFFEDIDFGADEDRQDGTTATEPAPIEPTPTEPQDDDGPSPDEPVVLPDPFVPQGFDGLIVYRVSAEEGFTELGRLSTRFEDAGYFWSSFTRGVFIGDDVFAVTDHGVRAAPLSDIASAPYELVFGSAPEIIEIDSSELEPVGGNDWPDGSGLDPIESPPPPPEGG